MTAQTALALPVTVKSSSRAFDAWRRRLLIGLVAGYAGVLVVLPLVGLIRGAFAQGVGAAINALRQPGVLASFGLTLEIALIVVAVHVVFGTAVAWVLARHKF
ncbi:MAG: sulfate/thiosulfate ABC transporter permease CysW, partial [Anaerolineales bacterium]